ncbi:MAG: permease, partial [Burkholderia sp.]|nr:permease [Burkholderia sp.]
MSDTPVQPTVDVGSAETDFGTKGVIDRYFGISSRGSTQRTEIVAGVT